MDGNNIYLIGVKVESAARAGKASPTRRIEAITFFAPRQKDRRVDNSYFPP
jgi:hypothetical protein